jgi:hypothetical protein
MDRKAETMTMLNYFSNAPLATLCANCHRLVHWLSTGDRALAPISAYDLGQPKLVQKKLRRLASKIRTRRLKVVGEDLVLTTAIPLATAEAAVIKRNGFDRDEGKRLQTCLRRALKAMDAKDRSKCSIRLVRQSRYISVNANNHLVIRVPAWSDKGYRFDTDIILIWPKSTPPSIFSEKEFRRMSKFGFDRIPCFNMYLSSLQDKN